MFRKHKADEDEVAIVGISCRFPGAKSYEGFWLNLEKGKNDVREIPESRWSSEFYSTDFHEPNRSISKWCGLLDDIERFDSAFFGISARESKSMDPQQRLLLQETVRCIEDSGIPLADLKKKKTGVYVGVMTLDYLIESNKSDVVTDSYSCLGNYESILANRLSHFFDFKGPSFSIDAACASSLVALHQAKLSLLSGESDYAIAGGVSLNLNPWKYISFSKSRMLSPDGQCKTFDQDANGYVPGEGVGVVLLQRLEDALKQNSHIYGVVKGSAVQHVGKSLSITSPDIKSQQALIEQVLQESNLNPEKVSYIEAHGTGTSLGDPIEVAALTHAFNKHTSKKNYCYLGSVKSNVGHLEAAAGVAGIIKVLMMMKYRKIAPTLNVKRPNPLLFLDDSAFKLALEAGEWQPEPGEQSLRAGISSFGFGGTMSHVILESSKPHYAQLNTKSTSHPFLLSAKTESALNALIVKWRSVIQKDDFKNLSLRDCCGTLATGREHYLYRWGCQVTSMANLQQQLQNAQPVLTAVKPTGALLIGDTTWGSFGQVKPFFRHASLVREQWVALRDDLNASIWFQSEPFDLNAKWNEENRDTYTFLSNYVYLASLLKSGFSPGLIAGQGSGIWLSLSLSGMLPVTEVLAILAGKLSPEDVHLSIPKIPFYDAVMCQTVRPFHLDGTYVSELVNNVDIGGQDWGKCLNESASLQNSQHTFKSYLNEWFLIVKNRGVDAETLFDHSLLSSKEKILSIVVIQSSLLKLYQKWSLSPVDPVEDKFLSELILLIAHFDLDKGAIVDLIIGNEFDSSVIDEYFSGETSGDFTEEKMLLKGKNQLPESLIKFSEWLDKAKRVEESGLIDSDMTVIEWGDYKQTNAHSKEAKLSPPTSLPETFLTLWKHGFDLKWKECFPDKMFSKLPLPVYEFGGERHWLNHKNKESQPVISTVVNKLIHDADKPHHYFRVLSPLGDSVIGDTVVEGQCITPSPLRLALALQAGKAESGMEVNSLKNVYFPNPGIIKDEVRMSIDIGDQCQFQLTKSELSGNVDTEEVLAKGLFEQADLSRPDDFNPDLYPVEKTESEAELYELFDQWGYQYGPGMCLIDRIDQTSDHFIIHIKAKPTDEAGSAGLDPFILDCMFQGVFYMGHIQGDLLKNRFLYVPISIKQLTLLTELASDCYAVINIADFHITDDGDIRLSFTAYDQQGSAVLLVDTIYFRRVKRDFLSISPKIPDAIPAMPDNDRYDTAERLTRTTQYLQKAVAESLGEPMDAIDIGAPLQEIGVDSLVNQEIVEKLAKVFPDLSSTVLFEYTTVKQLTGYFIKTYADRLGEILDLPLLTIDEPPLQGVGSTSAPSGEVSVEAARSATPMASSLDSKAIEEQLTDTVNKAANIDAEASEPVAIIGCSGRFPQAADLTEFWRNLKQGKNSITEVPEQRWDYEDYYDSSKRKGKSYTKWGGFLDGYDEFDPLFFNITPNQAQMMDPQQRVFLQTAWSSIEDAGYTRANLPRNTGVFVGVTTNTYALWAAQQSSVDSPQCPDTDLYDVANRVSYFCDFQGPSMSVDTACSSSLSCVHLAVQSLQRKECEMAVAGGVSLTLHPNRVVQFCQKNMLSSENYCHPFGEGKGGFVDSEGAGAIILKPLSAAIADGDSIYGVIRGTAINSGGRTGGYTVPSPKAQAKLVSKAIERAGVSARSISYLETHGTGTTLGDPIEVEGLTQAFRQHTDNTQFCAVGSVKSNIGHLISAAGISGLIKVLLQLKHRTLVPSLNASPTNSKIPFSKTPFYVQQHLSEWKSEYPRRAGVSSFGVGGSNAHVIVEEYAVDEPALFENEPCLIVISAKNKERLQSYVQKFLDFLPENLATLSLRNIAYTLQLGRESMEERLAFVVNNVQELLDALRKVQAGHDLGQDICFQTDSHSGNKKQTLSFEGEAGEAYIKVLLEQKQLVQLAALWVQGAEIDWQSLYKESNAAGNELRPRRISLPQYPFLKQRYWLPEEQKLTADVAEYNISSSTIHPLLDKVDIQQSFRQKSGLTFCKTLRPSDWILQDHQVNEQALLPGVACLEMARAAAEHIQNRSFNVKNMVWQAALSVEQSPVEVQLILSEQGVEGAISFEISSCLGVNSSGKKCAYGLLIPSPENNAQPEVISLNEIQARCADTMLPQTLYADFNDSGIRYGDTFQCINHVQKNDREALAFLKLPAALNASFNDYHNHPALMDAALQTALLLREDTKRMAMPFMVEEVLHYQAISAEVTVYVKKIGDLRFDVFLLTPAGAVCVQFKNVVFQPASPDPLDDFFYTPAWVAKDTPPTSMTSTAVTPQTVLAFLPPPEISHAAQRVVNELQQRNPSVRIVSLRESDFNAQAFPDTQAIYFLPGLVDHQPGAGDVQKLAMAQDFTSHALHRIVKALARSGQAESPLTFTVLTSPIYPVEASSVLFPSVAGLAGLTKTLIREYPHWRVNRVALNPMEILEGHVDVTEVLAEPRHTGAEEVAWHGGQRYIREMKPVQFKPSAQAPLRERGVYLIAGGLGGVGQQLSEYLAKNFRARLVLLGRKPLDSARSAQVKQIEEHGGEVLYLPTDLNSARETQRAIEQCLSRFGEIHGVFNSAIVLQDKALENMSEEDFRIAYDTKVLGSINLTQALDGQNLDFLIFFSSILSIVGNPGQGNYVAGGTFQDALSHYLNQRQSYPVQVVNWGYWGTVGIVATEDYQRRMNQQGMSSIAPEEGMEAILRILNHREAQVVAIKANSQLQEKMYVQTASPAPIYISENSTSMPTLLTTLGDKLDSAVALQSELFRFQEGYQALQQFAHQQLLASFVEMQILALSDAEALPSRFERFYTAAKRMLARSSLNLSHPSPWSKQEAISQQAFLAEKYPEIRAHLELLTHCLAHYTELFQETVLPTEVMFPGSSMAKVEGIYKNNPVSDYFNTLASHSVLNFIQEKAKTIPTGKKIRILEIGAGTGGTSAKVLETIQPYGEQLEYVYTDVSNFFLVHGKKQFAQSYPFVSFQLLDIVKDIGNQSAQPSSFDLILATNVLHATPNIKTTLSNVALLLKPDGWVVLNEMTNTQDMLTLTFGLLDGWWLYEDEEYRIQDSPLLTPTTWGQLFLEAGLPYCKVLGPAAQTNLNLSQSVIVAEKSSEPKSESNITQPSQRIQSESIGYEIHNVVASSVAPVSAPPVSVANSEVLEQQLLDSVLASVETASGIAAQEIDEDKPFSEYGIDSITGIELINALNQTLDISLSKTALFDYTTVSALSDYILEQYGDELDIAAPEGLAPSKATLESTASAAINNVPVSASPVSVVNSEALEQQLLDSVLASVETASGIAAQEIDEDKPFSEYGIDSITGIELINALNQTLDISLSKTALFDYTTVSALSDYILEQYGDELDIAAPEGLAPSKATLESTASILPQTSLGVVSSSLPPSSRIGGHCLHYGTNPLGNWQKNESVTLDYPITVESNNCIRDHVIYGQYIMPSDAYLEMLYIGAHRLLGYDSGLEVESFNLQFPMITFPGIALDCQLKLTPGKGNKASRFAIQSRKAGDVGAYQVSVDGRFRAIDGTTPVNNDFRQFWQPCEKVVQPYEIYTPDAILKVGPSYETIQAIHIQGQTAVSQLKRTPTGEPLRQQFVLEPSIVDGLFATGLYFASYLSGNPKDFFIPVLFDRIRVFRELHDDVYYGVVKTISVKAEHITFDLALVDEQGNEVLSFEGFHLQKILAEDLKKNAQAPTDQPIQTSAARTNKSPTKTGTPALSAQAVQPNSAVNSTDSGMAVAIIGMAGRFPEANSVDAFWENLASGRNSVTEVPADRWSIDEHYDVDESKRDKTYSKWGGFLSDVDCFDSLFFQISGKESELTDPQQRVFLEDCWHTLEDAGYSDVALSGLKLGVFAGATKGDYQLKMHHEDGAAIEGFSFPGNEPSVMAARISYFLNLKGPSIAINTACSSSLVAMNLACQSLLTGESDMALAGGIHICTTPRFYKLTSKSGMLSPTGECRAFDNDANGFVPGEASAAILLKPLDKALKDGDHVYGVVRGIGVNQDGKTNGMTAPSSVSQAELEVSVYERYGINPASINYIETHGTGTKLGDPIEIEALSNAFRKFTSAKQFCPIGSVKSNIGHTAYAAGVSGVIKVLQSMKHRKIAPSLHCHTPNEYINFADSPFYVNTQLADWEVPEGHVRRATVSSFGISGTNCHLVIDEPPGAATPEVIVTRPVYLIPISAKTKQAFKQKCIDLLQWFDGEGRGASVANIAYTLQAGRSHFAYRKAFLLNSAEELPTCLQTMAELEVQSKTPSREVKKEGKQLLKQVQLDGNQLSEQDYRARLQQFVTLYEQGFTPDWEALNPETDQLQRLSMPGYPFERERFWIPDTALQTETRGTELSTMETTGSFRHPLLDNLQLDLSLAQGLCYEKQFKPDDWLLQHHEIDGKATLPGVAYLEMARAALANVTDQTYQLSRVVWASPLVVDQPKTINIMLLKEQQQYRFVIRDAEGENYCNGEFVPSDPQAPPALEDKMTALQSALLPQVTGAQLYLQLQNLGVNHGAGLQCMQQIWFGQNSALAKLTISPEWKQKSQPYALSPVLLDGCLQLGAAFILQRNASQGITSTAFMPYSLEALEYFSSIPEECYVLLEERDEMRFNLTLMNREGQVCLRFCDVFYRYQKQTETLDDFFYLPRWQTKAMSIQSPPSQTARSVLFVSNDQPISISLTQSLRSAHQSDSLAEVRLGTQTQALGEQYWQIDCSSPSAIEDCLQTGEYSCPDRIYFMGSVQEAVQTPLSAEQLERSQQQSVLSLFRLIKALIKLQWIYNGIELCILTEGAQAVDAQETINPLGSGVFGLARTAIKEYPQLKINCVDFHRADAMPQLVNQIQSEPFEHKGQEVAFRQGVRSVLTLESISIPPAPQTIFRHQGVYMILGGAGGLGFTFSCYLAEKVQARLIWIGRSPLNPTLQEKIKTVEAKGGQVIYEQADVNDMTAIRQAVIRGKQHFGCIHGVIHSALGLHDKSLANMEESVFLKALAPKVQGSVNLQQAVSQEALDFLLFFSSGESFTCYAGQSNYAAACTFKDAFARYLERELPYPVKILNWGYWGTVGVVSSEDYRQQLAARGVYSIDPAEGMEAIERVMASSFSQVVPMKVSRAHLEELGVELYGEASPERGSELTGHLELIESPPHSPVASTTPLSVPIDAGIAIEQKVQDFIKTVFAETLKINEDSIDPEATFDVYGMDSLIITSVLRAFESHLGKLPVVTLYQHNTTSSLAEYLISEHREALETLPSIAAMQEEASAVTPLSSSTPIAEQSSFSASQSDSLQTPVAASGADFVTAPLTHRQPETLFGRESLSSMAPPADSDIAIIGIDGRYPMSVNTTEFWQNLKAGENCISEIPGDRWDWTRYHSSNKHQVGRIYSKYGGFIDDVDKFDALFFSIPPNEARLMDPQERLFIESAWTVLEDAGYTREALSNNAQQVGVFVGVMHADYEALAGELWSPDNPEAGHSSSWSLANRLSYLLDLDGPSLAVNTACSSSLTAIHLAYESFLRGECDVAIAGGVNLILHPKHYLRLSAATMITPGNQCKSFGADADGFVDGEGVGTVLLKPLASAVRDGDHIYGVIKASAMNSGGKTSGYTVPNPNAQAKVITKALRQGNIDPATINYVEAHGTGTSLGDPIEVTALTQAYQELGVHQRQYCALGSVKSNVGHLESAAGMAGLTKVLLQMKHKMLVPSLHASRLNPHIAFTESPFYVQQGLSEWHPVSLNGRTYPRRAGLSSFGAGGTNHHLIIEEYQDPEAARATTQSSNPFETVGQIFPLSAKEPEQLRAYARRQVRFLSEQTLNMRDVAYTLQQGREAMPERLAIVFSNQDDLLMKLEQWLQASQHSIAIDSVFYGRAQSDAATMSASKQGVSGVEQQRAMAQAWVSGSKIDWSQLPVGEVPLRRLALPTYPFEKQSHWLKGRPATAVIASPDSNAAPKHTVISSGTNAKSVAVIGGGPAGLAAAKCLLDDGHLPVLFEKTDRVGGIWCFRDDHQGGPYQSTRLQTSKLTSLFSDFPPPESMPVFPGVTALNQYLNDYADHFGLRPHIKLETVLESLTKEGEKWLLVLRKSDGSRQTQLFDAVSICTGGFWQPKTLSCPGMESFQGEYLHSSNYHSPEMFRGKRVLVVGNGVSGMDVAVDATKEADQVMISMRSKKMIIPRMFGFTTNDGSITSVKRSIIDKQKVPDILQEWRASIPQYMEAMEKGDLLPSFPVKESVLLVSCDFPQAVSDGKIQLKPELRNLSGNQCEFTDGSLAHIDIIVDCTGYNEMSLPFLPNSIQCDELYKHQFHPDHPTLCFIGRKHASLSVIPTLELEARWFSKVLSGTCSLPDGATMRKSIHSDYVKENRRGGLFPSIDSSQQNMWLAEQVGAFPNPVTNWKLYWKLINLPAIPATYRLVGSNSWSGAEAFLEMIKQKLYINQNDPRIEAVKHQLLARLGERNLETMVHLNQISKHEQNQALALMSSGKKQAGATSKTVMKGAMV